VVYNTLGQEIVKLIDKEMAAGYHEVTLKITNYSSGVYFYRLQAGSFIETKKMILLK
jgi:hypothetical protein